MMKRGGAGSQAREVTFTSNLLFRDVRSLLFKMRGFYLHNLGSSTNGVGCAKLHKKLSSAKLGKQEIYTAYPGAT